MTLTACSDPETMPNDQIVTPSLLPTNTMSSKVEVAEVPQISPQPATTVGVPETEIATKLQNAGQEAQDDWYIQQLQAAKIETNEITLLRVRNEVCDMLKDKASIKRLSKSLESYNYTEEQQGVLIASSMISACPEASAIIKESDLPK